MPVPSAVCDSDGIDEWRLATLGGTRRMHLLPPMSQSHQLLDEALGAGYAARFDRSAGECMLSAPALLDACALILQYCR